MGGARHRRDGGLIGPAGLLAALAAAELSERRNPAPGAWFSSTCGPLSGREKLEEFLRTAPMLQ